MDYSEDDKLILGYFFTNIDKPVFAAKNFHPEVWALMQARYSRSTEGLRQGFLKLLKEDEKNYRELLKYIKENHSGAKMDHAVNKAIQFMDKWVLGYGHSSVAEGATIGIGLEGISILATKVIEDNRLASYIEKSTRYVSFGKDSFYIPHKLKDSAYSKDVNELILLMFKTYMDLHEPILRHIKRISPLKEGENPQAYERSCAARRFDTIRYLLPACTLTSLGWTLNARQLAHAISKLLSHPLEEMRNLGERLREEGKVVLPSLLKYADVNRYYVETEDDMSALIRKRHAMQIQEKRRKRNPVELVSYEKDADDILVSSIIYRYSSSSFTDIRSMVRHMPWQEKQEIYAAFISKRGEYDPIHREFEHVFVTFDILMDYGAFRDIQRHRMCSQTNQIFTSQHGYEIPEDISDAGKEVTDLYISVMEKAKSLHKRIAEEDQYLAQYILPLAFRKRVLMTMNLREAFYFVKLRSTPQGHISYRRVARAMYELLRKKYPLLTKYFICNLSDDELGRLAQETKFEEKKNKGLF